MGLLQRLQKAVAAFMEEGDKAATEGQTIDPLQENETKQEPQVQSREAVRPQPAMDAQPLSPAQERQREQDEVEALLDAVSEYSDESPYPLDAAESAYLPEEDSPYEDRQYYYWSDQEDILEKGLSPSRYGYQLTEDKRAAQSHNDRGEVYLASVVAGGKSEEIDLNEASDTLIPVLAFGAKRRGMDRLIIRNASDGERIYDRTIVFRANQLDFNGKTNYEQDLAQVLPTLNSIVSTEPMEGTDGHRRVEFLMQLDGEEKLATALLDQEGHIIRATLADESYESLEMLVGRECDDVFGEGSFRFFQENPYYIYEPGNQEQLLHQKTQLISQLMDVSWEAELPEPIRFAFPDKTHVCHWVEYDSEQDMLSLGETREGNDRYPLYPESLTVRDFERLIGARDFYMRLQNLEHVAAESVPGECLDEMKAFVQQQGYARYKETVKGLENILEDYDQLGQSGDIMRQLSALRREAGMPTVSWQQFPQLDGDELDWLIRSYAYQLYAEGPNEQLPKTLAKHFPQLQLLAMKGSREDYLDLLGHIETMACCKWEEQQAGISYDETESVWQGGNAGGKWLECTLEAKAYQEDPTIPLNPDLADFRGVEHKSDGLWYGYRYEQPVPRVLAEENPFIAYAFAKGSMSEEEAHDWAQQIASCKEGLHFSNDVRVSLQEEPLYLGFTISKEGKVIGRGEIGASSLAAYIPLETHLEEISENLMQLAEGKSLPEPLSLQGVEPFLELNRIFPDNYKVLLENEYQWKLLSRYQEAKGIEPEEMPNRFPAERRINGKTSVDSQVKDKLIDIGDFVMGSYLETTPKAELDTLLSRFEGVFCTDLFEVHLERPQRVFDETGIRYYDTLIGKEGEYRLTSTKHDGNLPVPGYMNRQLVIDTLRAQEKMQGLRNKDVDNVLRWGVDVGDDHFMVKRMDDGLFYLSRDGYHGEGRGVELCEAYDYFEKAMQDSMTHAVRYHAEEDCSEIYGKMTQHNVSRYYLANTIPVTEHAQLSGLCFDEEKTPIAILTGRTQADFSEELEYPASLLPVRSRTLFEQQLTKEFSVSEKSHGMQVGNIPCYQGDREPEYNSILLAELRGKGRWDTPFNHPFCIHSDGHEYRFTGCQQGKVDDLPTFLFQVERDGYALQLPVRDLPHEIAITVVNETYKQLNEMQTTVESPKRLTVAAESYKSSPQRVTDLQSDRQQYLADTLYAYGIQSISFEQPIQADGIKIYQVDVANEVLTVDAHIENKPGLLTLSLDELPADVVEKVISESLDAVYSGQTESYRDFLTEGALKDILKAEGKNSISVDLPEYGYCEVVLQKDHVVLNVPEAQGRRAFSLPWMTIDSMQVKADIEEQLRSIPFQAEGERSLYEDSLCKLTMSGGQFFLEGQIQSYDVTEACRQLQEAGVNLNQTSRESLSAFCHRHQAVFETSQGPIKVQLYRANDEYQLKVESTQQRSPAQESEPVL